MVWLTVPRYAFNQIMNINCSHDKCLIIAHKTETMKITVNSLYCVMPAHSYSILGLYYLNFNKYLLAVLQGINSKVQNTVNDFLMLSNTQFIENVSIQGTACLFVLFVFLQINSTALMTAQLSVVRWSSIYSMKQNIIKQKLCYCSLCKAFQQ